MSIFERLQLQFYLWVNGGIKPSHLLKNTYNDLKRVNDMLVTEKNLYGEIIQRHYHKKMTEMEMCKKICELEIKCDNLDLELDLYKLQLKPFINLAKDYNLTLEQLYTITSDAIKGRE